MANEYPALKRFILPEKEVSLKLVFDNARNYVIVGAFVAMARWFASGKVYVPALLYGEGNDSYQRTVLILLCIVIAGVLFILNAAQSVSILIRLVDMLPVRSKQVETAPVRHSVPKSVLIQFLTWCFYAIFLAFVLVSIRMVGYIVWFSAVGSGR